jgi:hypothetical protein
MPDDALNPAGMPTRKRRSKRRGAVCQAGIGGNLVADSNASAVEGGGMGGHSIMGTTPEAEARWDWEWMASWGLLSGAFDATAQINASLQQAAHAGR